MTLRSGTLLRVRSFVALACALCPLAVGGRQTQPRQPLIAYLDSIAQARLKERARAIAAVRTRADAERRKSATRQTVLRLMGGLPTRRGPLAVRRFGSLTEEG